MCLFSTFAFYRDKHLVAGRVFYNHTCSSYLSQKTVFANAYFLRKQKYFKISSEIFPSMLSIKNTLAIFHSHFQGADQVTAICREPTDGESVSINRQLSEVDKLRKVIMELIDTERVYVKVNFLEFPFLRKEY